MVPKIQKPCWIQVKQVNADQGAIYGGYVVHYITWSNRPKKTALAINLLFDRKAKEANEITV